MRRALKVSDRILDLTSDEVCPSAHRERVDVATVFREYRRDDVQRLIRGPIEQRQFGE
jgi:hypothetical protein